MAIKSRQNLSTIPTNDKPSKRKLMKTSKTTSLFRELTKTKTNGIPLRKRNNINIFKKNKRSSSINSFPSSSSDSLSPLTVGESNLNDGFSKKRKRQKMKGSCRVSIGRKGKSLQKRTSRTLRSVSIPGRRRRRRRRGTAGSSKPRRRQKSRSSLKLGRRRRKSPSTTVTRRRRRPRSNKTERLSDVNVLRRMVGRRNRLLKKRAIGIKESLEGEMKLGGANLGLGGRQTVGRSKRCCGSKLSVQDSINWAKQPWQEECENNRSPGNRKEFSKQFRISPFPVCRNCRRCEKCQEPSIPAAFPSENFSRSELSPSPFSLEHPENEKDFNSVDYSSSLSSINSSGFPLLATSSFRKPSSTRLTRYGTM